MDEKTWHIDLSTAKLSFTLGDVVFYDDQGNKISKSQIEAAPDLLAVAELLVQGYEMEDHVQGDNMLEDAVGMAHAALAKVRGER